MHEIVIMRAGRASCRVARHLFCIAIAGLLAQPVATHPVTNRSAGSDSDADGPTHLRANAHNLARMVERIEDLRHGRATSGPMAAPMVRAARVAIDGEAINVPPTAPRSRADTIKPAGNGAAWPSE
jgi:hypothetical protein